jgi:hypothetical protein
MERIALAEAESAREGPCERGVLRERAALEGVALEGVALGGVAISYVGGALREGLGALV